jgi:hypothetical protein
MVMQSACLEGVGGPAALLSHLTKDVPRAADDAGTLSGQFWPPLFYCNRPEALVFLRSARRSANGPSPWPLRH